MPCCGFDSTPFDLGALLVDHLKQRYGKLPAKVLRTLLWGPREACLEAPLPGGWGGWVMACLPSKPRLPARLPASFYQRIVWWRRGAAPLYVAHNLPCPGSSRQAAALLAGLYFSPVS